MNLNRVLYLLPLFILVGGCADGADMAASPVATETTKSPVDGSARLASQTTDPATMKAAAVKRAVIQNGSLGVRVPNVEEAERKANDYVTRSGGFVASSESSDLTGNAATITMKLRVPANGFEQSMRFFEEMGTRLNKKVSGEDVTAQLVDFDARLKIMRAQEDSFRGMLAKATDVSTSSELQTRIMDLRGQIEGLAAQRATMSDLATLSTIELTLVGQAKGMTGNEDKGWAQESWNSSTSTLGVLFRGIGSVGIFLLVLSPLWLPVAFLVHRSIRKSRPRAA